MTLTSSDSKTISGSIALAAYRSKGHRRVEGWLLPGAIEATCDLAEMQRNEGIVGPVCEIGVHHGRLFILLHLLTSDCERSLAIDLFERQAENVDGSGSGSRDQLLHNLNAHRCDLARIELLAENSLSLDASRIVRLCHGRPRLFSVDGGHTAEATFNDISLAEASVPEGGIIILDDYFNSAWPGVSEGTCKYMTSSTCALQPIAIGFNKFFFTLGAAAAGAYRRRLHERRPHAKLSRVFNREVLCFEAPSTMRQRIAASRRWQGIRDTPLGTMLRSGARRWL